VITLVIGIGLIAISLIQPAFIFGDAVAPLDISDVTGFTLIDVPIDPTGGQILGTVKFGAPIVKPFERSGTILSADGGCAVPVDINDPRGRKHIPFGRIGSGDRNAEVSFHNFNGVNCGYGYAEWDLTDLPNDFVATGFTLQLNLKSIQSGLASCSIGFVTNTFDEIGERNIATRMVYGNDGGAVSQIKNTLGGEPVFDPITGEEILRDFLAVGRFVTNQPKFDTDWCEKTGVKRWTFSKIEPTGFRVLADGTVLFDQPTGVRLRPDIGVDAFNKQLQFDPVSQLGNDKFMLVFYGGSIIGGTGSNVIDHQWWEENGSLLITGASQPIRCDIGFRQVDFRCVPIVCDVTFQLNQVTNECEPIQCEADENLQVIEEPVFCTLACIDDGMGRCLPCPDSISRAVCVPIVTQPPMTECESPLILIGETCQDPTFQCEVILNCQEGTRPDLNGCSCQLIECPTGQELIGDQCQGIICPDNTRLVGNDCQEITCGIGQIAVNNVCQDEDIVGVPDCEAGFKALGNICTPIELDCPAGTEEFENNCRNIVPSLLQVSGIDPTLFLITGLVIVGMSGVGIVARRRA